MSNHDRVDWQSVLDDPDEAATIDRLRNAGNPNRPRRRIRRDHTTDEQPPAVRVLRNPEHPPVALLDEREYCSNGHPWKGNTRWRWRNRGGRHGAGWERDCLMCKDAADKARARSRARRGAIVLVTEHGTIWNQ